MKRIRVINAANFGSGRLQLSTEQAKARLHNLKHVKDDIYEIDKPVQFKAGEEIGFDGEINKLLMLDIEEAEAEKKEPEKLQYPEGEALELIETALTIAEVDEIIDGDNRKKVLKAAEKKMKALEEELEKEAMR